jgi:hypothetical protein
MRFDRDPSITTGFKNYQSQVSRSRTHEHKAMFDESDTQNKYIRTSQKSNQSIRKREDRISNTRNKRDFDDSSY